MTAANSLDIKAISSVIPSFFTPLPQPGSGRWVPDEWNKALSDVSTHTCPVGLTVALVGGAGAKSAPFLHLSKEGTEEQKNQVFCLWWCPEPMLPAVYVGPQATSDTASRVGSLSTQPRYPTTEELQIEYPQSGSASES